MVSRNRRSVLKLIGLGAGTATVGVAAGRQQAEATSYAIVQGDSCVHVTPLSGSEPVEQFYDWAPNNEKRWSSNGTTALQREDTSIAFLYDGPQGTTLVFVHGKLGGDGSGGSLSVTIDGLPRDGAWVVEDDNYDGPNNFDNWTHAATGSEIDWTWAGSRTDGGAFRGVTADDTIRVVPRFNETATLYGQYYQGDVRRWEFLSGAMDNPERIQLAMDQPLIVGGVDCSGDGSSGGSNQGDGGGEDKKDRKHQRKQEKHRKKERKHEKKEEKKERKHEKKQRKHERKEEKKERKHEKKQRKHERKEEKEEEESEEDVEADVDVDVEDDGDAEGEVDVGVDVDGSDD